MIAQTNKPDKHVRLSYWNQTKFIDKKKHRVTQYICIVVAYFIELPRQN